MALTTSGVQEAKMVFNEIMRETAKLTEVNDVINFMNSNEDFSKFVSGTTFGQENYAKWQKLLKLLSSDLNQALTNLNNATSDFLQRQDNYNNKLLYSSTSSTSSSIGSMVDNVDTLQEQYQHQVSTLTKDIKPANKFSAAISNNQNIISQMDRLKDQQMHYQQVTFKPGFRSGPLDNSMRNGQ